MSCRVLLLGRLRGCNSLRHGWVFLSSRVLVSGGVSWRVRRRTLRHGRWREHVNYRPMHRAVHVRSRILLPSEFHDGRGRPLCARLHVRRRDGQRDSMRHGRDVLRGGLLRERAVRCGALRHGAEYSELWHERLRGRVHLQPRILLPCWLRHRHWCDVFRG